MSSMELQAYPGTQPPFPLWVSSQLEWDGSILHFQMKLSGELQNICGLMDVVETNRLRRRRDELWKTTCFEFFLKRPNEAYYVEGNLSSQGDWAFYEFESYRQPAIFHSEIFAPDFVVEEQQSFLISARWNLSGTPLIGAKELLVSPSAVIEAAGGSLSYWAVTHSQSKPDFHHPEQFVTSIRQKD